MNVKTLCLAVLSCSDSTGYEIRKLVTDGHFSHFVDASYGSIYPALARLENDGLVDVHEVVQAGKPTRKVYSINAEGRAEFARSLATPAQPDVFKSEFLLLAMFAEHMEPRDVTRCIDTQIAALSAQLAIIDEQVDEVALAAAEWVADYGRHCLRHSLDYLLANRERLEAIAGSARGDALLAAE